MNKRNLPIIYPWLVVALFFIFNSLINLLINSNDFSLENRLQSEDRAHRIGQHKSVTYIDLQASNTVDQRIVAALQGKQDVANMVINFIKEDK